MAAHTAKKSCTPATRHAETSTALFQCFTTKFQFVLWSHFSSVGLITLRDEGLLRKEPPAEHSAFEALTERVTQITTAFQQKNHNYEGCHAVRLLSWLTVVAATQHSILGEVQATARIQAEVASRLGGAGRGARGAETDDGYRKKD